MKLLLYALVGAGLAFILTYPLAFINQQHRHTDAMAEASRQAAQAFAQASPGHALLLARYSGLERDRAAARAVTVWEPNACEREALAVLFDLQAQAANAVPRPFLLRLHDTSLPLALSGATLSPMCQVALNPGPALPPLGLTGMRPAPAAPPPPLTPTRHALPKAPASLRAAR